MKSFSGPRSLSLLRPNSLCHKALCLLYRKPNVSAVLRTRIGLHHSCSPPRAEVCSCKFLSSSASLQQASTYTDPNASLDEALIRLFRCHSLHVDISPVKRPLLEGSIWFEAGRIKVTLVNSVYGNSKDDVVVKLREKAEALAAQLHPSVEKNPSSKENQSVTKVVNKALGKALSPLLNHLDIQLHIVFTHTDKDRTDSLITSLKDAAKEKEFRCLIFIREVWEARLHWVCVADVSQKEAVPSTTFPSKLQAALKKATMKAERILLRKREAFYFESNREAELILRDTTCSTTSTPLDSLKQVSLQSSLLSSQRCGPVLVKVTLTDEKGNQAACTLPLHGGSYIISGKKLHVASNFQFSCVADEQEVTELALEPPSEQETRETVRSFILPSPQRALQLLTSLLPTLWHQLMGNTWAADVIEYKFGAASVPAIWEAKKAFTSAIVAYVGSTLHETWASDYAKARGVPRLPIVYVSFLSSAKSTVEKYEVKLSHLIGWRQAPVLQVLCGAKVIAFAVSDAKKHVYTLGTIFENEENLAEELGENCEPIQSNLKRSGKSTDDQVNDEEDIVQNDYANSNIDLISVEETLKKMGVTSSRYDNTTHSLHLTCEKNGESSVIEFRNINQPEGIARLLKFCSRHPKQMIFQSVSLNTQTGSYARLAQRLLSLAMSNGRVKKPLLRGNVFPIPLPLTDKFAVFMCVNNLERESKCIELLNVLQPYSKLLPDFPSTLWPSRPLTTPCFFNLWAPTKKLLERLGLLYYCAVKKATNLTEQQTSNEGQTEGSEAHSVGQEKNEKAYTLCVYDGIEEDAVYSIPLNTTDPAELPMVILEALHTLVHSKTTKPLPKEQIMFKIEQYLCDRCVPREIVYPSENHWGKMIIQLYNNQTLYSRQKNQYVVSLQLSANWKPTVLARIDVDASTKDNWKSKLATAYAERYLLPCLEPAISLYNQALDVLKDFHPLPGSAEGSEKFMICIKFDISDSTYRGLFILRKGSFRKPIIQGVPSLSPTAAIASVLDKMNELSIEQRRKLALRAVNKEVDLSSADTNGPLLTTDPAECILKSTKPKEGADGEREKGPEDLASFLQECQEVVRHLLGLSSIVHEYCFTTRVLVLIGTSASSGASSNLISDCCQWNEIPLVLPSLYAKLAPSLLDLSSTEKVERLASVAPLTVLERTVCRALGPGISSLLESMRVVQRQEVPSWYAELKLPAELFKIKCVGKNDPGSPNVLEKLFTSAVDRKCFWLSSKMSTKKGALRTVFTELYRIYVARTTTSTTLRGSRAPSEAALAESKKKASNLHKNLSGSLFAVGRVPGEKSGGSSPVCISSKELDFPSSYSAPAAAGTRMLSNRESSDASTRRSEAPKESCLSLLEPRKVMTARTEAAKRTAAFAASSSGADVLPAHQPTATPSSQSAPIIREARKVSKPRQFPANKAASKEEKQSSALKMYTNMCEVLLALLNASRIQTDSSQYCCLELGQDHIIRVRCRSNCQQHERRVIDASFDQRMWLPYQLLSVMLKTLELTSSRLTNEGNKANAALRIISRRLLPPNTSLTPNMPAKQFCVFFFRRYFGWQVCDESDLADLRVNQPASATARPHLWIVVRCEKPSIQGKKKASVVLSETSPASSFSYTLATSTSFESDEEAVNGCWEACMVKIITTFHFSAETNIYEYHSLDEALLKALI